MILEFAIFGALSIACLTASQQVMVDLGRNFALALAGIGTVFGAASIYALGETILHACTRLRKEWNAGSVAGEIARVNAQAAFIRQVASLTPEQLAFVGRVKATVVLEPGSIEPEQCILLGNNELILRQEVRDFIQRCDEVYLCPVSRWSEGTEQRHVAELVTAFMVKNQYAETATSRYAAKWLLREAGLKAIGEGV